MKHFAAIQVRESGLERASVDPASVFQYRYVWRQEGHRRVTTREQKLSDNIIHTSEWIATPHPSRVEIRPGVRRYNTAGQEKVYTDAGAGLTEFAAKYE